MMNTNNTNMLNTNMLNTNNSKKNIIKPNQKKTKAKTKTKNNIISDIDFNSDNEYEVPTLNFINNSHESSNIFLKNKSNIKINNLDISTTSSELNDTNFSKILLNT